MQVQKITTSILKNKYFLAGLEKLSDHAISFSAWTSLLMSSGVRPLSIYLTPDTEKENKQYAMANSICSGIVKFGVVEAVALPVENMLKKFDKNPDKYLNSKTVKEFMPNKRAYKFLTQTIKQSTNLLTAIPKSVLTIALIPVIMDNLFFNNLFGKKQINNSFNKNTNNPNFTGNPFKLSKWLSKIIENKTIQKAAKKYETKDQDIAKHLIAATDIALTSTSVYQTNKSKDIKENRKKALIYNNIISTAITIIGGYGIDGLIKNKSNKFIDKFSKLHSNNPKLPRYIEGINILRPAIIFAAIYYGILPIFSTYMAEKIDKYILRSNIHNKYDKNS